MASKPQPVPADIAPNRLYTYKEVAAITGLNTYYIRNAVLDERIPSIRLNARGIRRIRGRDLREWLDNGGVQ